MYLYSLFKGYFMRLLNFLLATVTITSTVFASDQNCLDAFDSSNPTTAVTTQSIFKARADSSFYSNFSSLLSHPTYVEYPPRREKINLHQLFSSDTGHPDVDQKAFNLSSILLGDEEKIRIFRTLPESVQISAAIDVSKLACRFSVNEEDFKKRCEKLLSGSTTSLLLADYVAVDDSKFFIPSDELAQTPAQATTVDGQ